MGKNNKRHDYEKVKKEFEGKNYTLVSTEYKNKNEKLDYICNKHQNLGVQYVSYASFSSHQCNCSGCKRENQDKKIGVKRNLPKLVDLYYDKYFEKYKQKLQEQIDGEEYILNKVYSNNGRIMLDLIHLKCNEHYHVEQNKFFNSHNRCQNPKCKFERRSIKRKRSNDDILAQIYKIVGNEYSVLTDYCGSNENMKFRHNKCNHIFNMTPHNFIFGEQRCPKCAQLIRNEKITKTHEEFLIELENKYPGEYDVLDKYINSNTKIRFLHKSCSHITNQTPYRALNNLSICKFCDYPTRGEQRIIDYLDSVMFGEYEYQQCYEGLVGINNGELSYDFYISKYNLLIEYQGEYHDGSVSCQTIEEIKIQQEHDRRKREYAKQHNINLLEIWYWDFDNIEEIIQNKLNEIISKKEIA